MHVQFKIFESSFQSWEALFDRDEVVIRIVDDGIGISSEMLPRIFDLFAQAKPATEYPSSGGLGIGLALARTYVEMHHGTIAAASAGIGRGSEFTVRLPACCERYRFEPSLARPEAARHDASVCR